MKKSDAHIKIDPNENSPVVLRLLSIIETLQTQLLHQTEKIDQLLAEIRQLKKLSPKPKIKPSTLPKKPKDPDDDTPSTGGSKSKKRPGSNKP